MLVLRSRQAGYRKPALSERGESIALRGDTGLTALLRGRGGVYNRQAAELERRRAGSRCGAQVLQITVPDNTRLIGRLESNRERVTEALRLGAKAISSAILTGEIDHCLQPVIYRTTPRASAPSTRLTGEAPLSHPRSVSPADRMTPASAI